MSADIHLLGRWKLWYGALPYRQWGFEADRFGVHFMLGRSWVLLGRTGPTAA